MFRVRITRFGDRGSYKSSEVVGLFLLSIFMGMLVCGVAVLIDQLIGRIFGTHA